MIAAAGRRSTGCGGCRRPSAPGDLRPAAGRRRPRPVARADGRVARGRAPRAPTLWPQVAGRATGLLTGHHTTLCLFDDPRLPGAARPAASRAGELAAALRDPAVRGAIVSWTPPSPARPPSDGEAFRPHLRAGRPARLRAGAGALAGRPSPRPRAARRWRWPTTPCSATRSRAALLPDPQLRPRQPRPVREMLLHPRGLPGLADGGAHCGTICDASAHVHAHPLDRATAPAARGCRSSRW